MTTDFRFWSNEREIMNEELEVLKEVTKRLDEGRISYLVSGSIAANYYTIPRMTRDLDVVVEMKVTDIDRFIRLFQADFFVDPEMVREEVKQRGMFNLIHTKYVMKIDFILRKESAWQETAFSRRKKISIDSIPVWIISLEDLILAKLLWAQDSLSELQLNDVRSLLKSDQRLEQEYLKKWVQALNLENVYQKVQE